MAAQIAELKSAQVMYRYWINWIIELELQNYLQLFKVSSPNQFPTESLCPTTYPCLPTCWVIDSLSLEEFSPDELLETLLISNQCPLITGWGEGG